MNGKRQWATALMFAGLAAGLVLSVVLSDPKNRSALVENGKALLKRD
jgi:hypothetical protein